MLKRLLILALPIAILAVSVGFAAQEGGEQHRGEIMSIDSSAKSITVKIVTNGEKMNHIYKVTDGVTIIRDASLKVVTFADLKNGMHIQIDSKKQGGDRIAKEITIKAAKGSKKKK